MERDDVRELHYICPVSNVASVLTHGILSHVRAEHIGHRSVASEEVQARRAQRRIPGGLRLHEYANLYFNGRNAMLFKLIYDYEHQCRVAPEQLVVMRISDRVLDLPNVVVTDINAAADVEPRWHTVQEGLPALVAAEIFAGSWNHADPVVKRRHMQRMMAEVLVPHGVAPEYIIGAYVVSAEVVEGLTQVAPTLPMVVRPYVFFQGGTP